MITVTFFGFARDAFKTNKIEVEARSVRELLHYLADTYDIKYREIKKFVIFVNEVNITQLHMYLTKLNPGDKVLFMSPVSGG